MITKTLKRALLDPRWPLPPPFLLPWAAGLTTISHSTAPGNAPPPLLDTAQHTSSHRSQTQQVASPPLLSARDNIQPQLPDAHRSATPSLSDSVRELLPVLHAQRQHYIIAHIYDRPYLVTQGDTVRLPFRMKGVEPGDVLRLDKASVIGSRDYTLKAAAPPPVLKSPTTSSTTILDSTMGDLASFSTVMPEPGIALAATGTGQAKMVAPHFVPHIAKGKVSYLDERLFVCRAVVMGVESEPMQIKEKTKRRQRRVKRVKSKHRHTILRIKEVRVRSLEEIETGDSL